MNETWDDAEWRAAASAPSSARTADQQYLAVGGPRPHPWGAAAYVGELTDGRRAFFPSEAAYRAYRDGQPAAASAQPSDVTGQAALGAINAGLAAAGSPTDDDDALYEDDHLANPEARLSSANPAVASAVRPGK